MSASSRVAEDYYDSADADAFYATIWGGEDIHVGLYDPPDLPIRAASHATVEHMARTVGPLSSDSHVLDLGAGYGGAARYLAERFGCSVTCLNISETQNAHNRKLTEAAGLADKVTVLHGTFESVPADDASFDVVWSQDALLHSSWRERALAEAARVLKPGGQLIFTDPCQSDDCPAGVLDAVLDRIHLDSLGSFAFYRQAAAKHGLAEKGVEDLTVHLGRHYARVRQVLESRYEEMTAKSSKAYVDRMIAGLQHWVDGASRGYLAWGILHFVKQP
ncbi:MAG: SAM-dependent methyltransferase [Rhodothalassiaceae bacterium]